MDTISEVSGVFQPLFTGQLNTQTRTLDAPLLAGLVATWRERAAVLRETFDTRTADLIERMAGELETRTREQDERLLAPAEAAEASGYTADHLRRLHRSGKLTNHGRTNKPRYKLAELPRKALREIAPTDTLNASRGRGLSLIAIAGGD